MQITSGLDALNMLNDEGQSGQQNEFTNLKSGDVRKVKVISPGDVIGVQTYSIFKQVPTFTPEKLPQLSQRGNPVGDFTPFDLAYKHHMDQSKDFGDAHSTEAYKYKIKPRFAFGFYDLDEKEFIVIDFSKAQAQVIHKAVSTQAERGRLDKRAFELEKSGSGTGTTISMTAEPFDDLSDAQAKAFEEAPEEFPKEKFENLYFTRNEDQMKEALQTAGFDLSLIGLEPPKGETETSQAEENPFEGQKTYDDVVSEDPTQNF